MSELNELSNTPGTSTAEKLVGCKWSSCKKQHEKKPDYPESGRTTKGGYRAAWIAAKMDPWELFGRIRKRLQRNGREYRTMTYEYKTQAHHLVPTTLVRKTSTLKKNLELIGYDCDDKANGLILPEFEIDSALHELQAHRGNHPAGYMSPIRDELAILQETYDGICEGDPLGELTIQASLLGEMQVLADTARQKILNIRTSKGYWPLRSNALAEYKKALVDYAAREELHKAVQP